MKESRGRANKQQIQKIIKDKFKPRQKFLNLQDVGIWSDVLTHCDWSQLKQLNLRNCSIDNENIKVVARLNWPNLQKLLLWKNKITQEGIKYWMGNSWPQLSSLELDCNKIGDKGLETLMLNLHNIKIVQVANNGITSIGIDKALLAHEIKQLPFLQKLNISENKLGAAGIKLLVKCNLTRLRDLEINKCQIGDEGAKITAKGIWNDLAYLHIENGIGVDGHLSVLARIGRQMKYLSVGQRPEFHQSNIVEIFLGFHFCVAQSEDTRISYNVINNQIQSYLYPLNHRFWM